MTQITVIPGPTQTLIYGLPKDAKVYPTNRALDEFSFKADGYMFTKAFYGKGGKGKKRGWDGRVKLLKLREQGPDAIPTGMLTRLERVMRECCHQVVYSQDARPFYDKKPVDPAKVSEKLTPFAFQDEAVRYILHFKRGVLWAPARVGKTLIAIETYRRTSLSPFLFMAWSLAAAEQAVDAFRYFLPGVKVGLVGDGHAETDAEVVVASVQSLAAAHGLRFERNEKPKEEGRKEQPVPPAHHTAIRELVRQARAVAWDECHHCAGRVSRALSDFLVSAEIVFGLTATPWREDNRDLVIEAVCGPVIYHMSVSEAVALGRQVPLEIMVFELPDRGLVVEKGKYQEAYQDSIVNNEEFHGVIQNIVGWLRQKGNTVAVIVSQLPHGKILNKVIPGSSWVHGETPNDVRRRDFAAVNNGEDTVLISTLINEAMDLPGLSAVVVADVKSSGTLSVQRATRAATAKEGKKKAVVVMFEFPVKYLSTHSHRAVNFLRAEPAYAVYRRKINADWSIGPSERLSCVERPRGDRSLELHPYARTPERVAAAGSDAARPRGTRADDGDRSVGSAGSHGHRSKGRVDLGAQGALPLLSRKSERTGQ